MRHLYRIFSIFTLSALMAVPALRAQDDRQYDPQTDDQATVQSEDDQQYQAEATAPSSPDADDRQQQPDPPARAARLQFMNGSV